MKRIYDLLSPRFLDGSIGSVLDLGAGDMYLQKLLPPGVAYYPVDYLSRCGKTIVCDFNKCEFPDQKADLVVAAGLFHFVEDPEWLLRRIYDVCGDTLAITYTPTELEPDIEKREKVYLWVNHFSYAELYGLFMRAGFLPVHCEKVTVPGGCENQIFLLKKRSPARLPAFSACTGCGLCAALCPTKALEMRPDQEGFARPSFDGSKCIDCGRCTKACPALSIKYENTADPASYAVWAEDAVRMESSSGGVFTLLARRVLREGGAVCGARFDPDSQQVRHVLTRDEAGLAALRGSKYVQSDLTGAFAPVRELLEKGTPVLFCGCPCQVAAIRTYVGQENSARLYTADLLCTGVTAPEIFKRYLSECHSNEEIADVQFRTKEHGWDSTYLTITSSDGQRKTAGLNDDTMEQVFHGFFALRPSCYACPFAAFPRQGDLTIGDFWGVQNFDPALDDQKGTSFVCVNNDRGERMLAWLQEDAKMIRPVPWQYTGTNRLTPLLAERCRMPRTRERFYHLLQTRSLQEAVYLTTKEKYDVGVVCNWSGDNYGAQITQYAFYHTLTQLGKEPLMIERPSMPYPGGNGQTAGLFRENPYPGYATCALYEDLEQMRDINRFADTFVVPSDQLWSSLFAEKDLLALGLIENNKKKISYATSFGHDPHNWNEDDRAREAFFLRQLDAVSVREDSAVRILREDFGVEGAVRTLDPVFLCDGPFYDELCSKSRYAESGGHLAAFILDPDPQKALFIEQARQTLNKESIQLTDAFDSASRAGRWSLPVEENIRVEDLLAVIRGSAFVITDSFHGVCFAILFEKPFIALGNRERGMSRFESLLGLLGLEDRLVPEADEAALKLLGKPVDYGRVRKILAAERIRSVEWLANALNAPKKAALTAYDILDKKLYDVRREVRELQGSGGAAVNERIGAIDRELLRANQSIDAVNTELLRINQVSDAMNAELLRTNQSVDAVNAELLRTNQSVDAVNAELLRMNQASDAVNAELLRINQVSDAMNAELLRMNQASDAVNAELLRMNQASDAVNAELLRMNQASDAVNAELLRINQNVDAINGELLRIDQNMDAIHEELLQTDQKAEAASAALEETEKRLSQELGWIEGELRSAVDRISGQIERLERSPFYRLGEMLAAIPRWLIGGRKEK